MIEHPEPRIVAYLDESGCAGSQFGKGSSEWLVIGAVVFALNQEDEILSVFREPIEPSDAPPRFKKFSSNRDPSNFLITQRISKKPVRIIQVALHKPSMVGSHIRGNHQEEYQFLCKFAIERISWIARDSAAGGDPNHSLVRLVFSEQKMYPYEALAEYLNKLKNGKHNCSIEWQFIHPVFTSKKHEDNSGLHLADMAASALAKAIERKQHGMTDDRFQRNLIPVLYRKYGKQYGLKLFPSREMQTLITEERFEFFKLL